MLKHRLLRLALPAIPIDVGSFGRQEIKPFWAEKLHSATFLGCSLLSYAAFSSKTQPCGGLQIIYVWLNAGHLICSNVNISVHSFSLVISNAVW